ncbi:ABC transporter substrate-binding protein [Flaviflagellibacter deserti]|uniref:ABC transporter substrate-binding protein n=1 Tax=Flaviflagellibacter deserti TaxID=2267266 RepID=A0ABV9Z0G1_9HYPH
MRFPILLTSVLSAVLLASSPSTAQAPAGGGKVFRYAYRVDPASLDPHALAETFTLSWLGQVYEPLVGRGKNLELVPALATKWEQPEPNVWRFHLRTGVKFADGSPFTADDVVFSLQRVKKDGSDMAYTVASVTEIKKVDDFTVDLVMAKPNPILPVQTTSTYIMSKAWAEKNGATAPASVKAKVENFASNNANGTGPFKIESRQAGVRTILVPNKEWWGEKETNVDQVVFTPIQADTTRVAALLSGEVDMIYPVPQQDAARIDGTGTYQVLKGAELRTMFLNMDQKRDELLNSDVKGKNPFKDRRVRQAIYQAIDVNAIRDRVMGGTSRVAGTMIAPGINGYDAKLDTRIPYDADAAKKLLADAGYPNGFSFGMDCSNDRYVNDERICQAIVGMLARVGLKVTLNAQTRTKFFEKVLARDTSFAMLGWQPLSYDAHSTLQDTMNTPVDKVGTYNVGNYSNHAIDKLTMEIETEIDPAKRSALIAEAMTLDKDDFGHIPVHQAGLAWGVKKGVSVVLRSDDSLELKWVKLD